MLTKHLAITHTLCVPSFSAPLYTGRTMRARHTSQFQVGLYTDKLGVVLIVALDGDQVLP